MTRNELKKIIKECIVEIKEDNEALSEGFLDRFKKNRLTSEQKSIIEKDFKALYNAINDIVKNLKGDKEYRDFCKKQCKKYNEDIGYDSEIPNEYFMPSLFVDYGYHDTKGSLTIFDADEFKNTMKYFCGIYDIILKKLKEEYSDLYKKFKISINREFSFINIDYIAFNKSSENVKEGSEELESVEEGVIGTISKVIFGLLFAPYIAVFCILIIIYPFIKISNIADKKKLEKFFAQNPELKNSIRKFSKSVYDSLCKLYPKNKDFLVYNFDNKLKLSTIRRKDKSEEYIITVSIIGINGSNILKDATGYSDVTDYGNSLEDYDDYDVDPECEEFNKRIHLIKKSVADLNNIIKEKFGNGYISIKYNDTQINDSYILSNYGCEEVDGISRNAQIEIHIQTKDYANIKLPDSVKGIVNKQVERLRPKFDKYLQD